MAAIILVMCRYRTDLPLWVFSWLSAVDSPRRRREKNEKRACHIIYSMSYYIYIDKTDDLAFSVSDLCICAVVPRRGCAWQSTQPSTRRWRFSRSFTALSGTRLTSRCLSCFPTAVCALCCSRYYMLCPFAFPILDFNIFGHLSFCEWIYLSGCDVAGSKAGAQFVISVAPSPNTVLYALNESSSWSRPSNTIC